MPGAGLDGCPTFRDLLTCVRRFGTRLNTVKFLKIITLFNFIFQSFLDKDCQTQFFLFFPESLQQKGRCAPFPEIDNGPNLPSARTHWVSIPSTGPKSQDRQSSSIHGICVEAVVPEFHIWGKKLECLYDLCQNQQQPGRLAQQNQL